MQSLTKQLDVFLAALLERVDPATSGVIQRMQHELAARDLPHTAVGEGDVAPDFTLPDQHGRMVSLRDERAHGPVVLVFFRGGWCPFCSLTLRAMNDMHPQILRAGGRILAISPQTPANTLTTAERHGLQFPVLSDHGNAAARRYGLVWRLEGEVRELYARLGHDLPRLNGTPDWELPIGAGYVVTSDGIVSTAKVDPALARRLEPQDALRAVKSLADGPGAAEPTAAQTETPTQTVSLRTAAAK